MAVCQHVVNLYAVAVVARPAGARAAQLAFQEITHLGHRGLERVEACLQLLELRQTAWANVPGGLRTRRWQQGHGKGGRGRSWHPERGRLWHRRPHPAALAHRLASRHIAERDLWIPWVVGLWPASTRRRRHGLRTKQTRRRDLRSDGRPFPSWWRWRRWHIEDPLQPVVVTLAIHSRRPSEGCLRRSLIAMGGVVPSFRTSLQRNLAGALSEHTKVLLF